MTGGAAFAALIIPIPVVCFYFYCLIDFSRTDERDMRTYPRQTWVAILLFANVAGGLLWLYQGRPQPPPRWLPPR